jgi:osomolarity two-component system phosphorelay intermediate protein YPD1
MRWTMHCADKLWPFSLSTCSLALRKKKDLKRLSSLGHFLKGSSAALGLCKVQASCEDIQHYGQLQERDEVIKEDYAITKIGTTLERARGEYETAKSSLQRFYRERDGEGLAGK